MIEEDSGFGVPGCSRSTRTSEEVEHLLEAVLLTVGAGEMEAA